MVHFNWITVTMMVVITLDIIALIAMIFARSALREAIAASELASTEVANALREIDRLSSLRNYNIANSASASLSNLTNPPSI